MPDPLVLALVGLAVGPLLGVLVDRAVEREPLEAHHRCRSCRASLGARSLVPVVSWFGTCPGCANHPGWRYPAVDVATAASLAVVGARFGIGWPALAYGLLCAVLVVLSVIDLETHLLPNVITYPAFVVGLAVIVVLSVTHGYAGGITSALTGAVFAFALLLFFHVLQPRGMGLGDVKLAPTLGLFLGWLYASPVTAVVLVLYAVLAASLGGGLVGLAVNLARRRRMEIPFGPALALGTVVVIALSPALVGPAG
jgi:leader peptidase (prepilin peptidase)/N-methyltransferase